MTRRTPRDISICIFGSSARMTNDEMSDRDVLIVASDRRSAKDEITRWKAAGWSVSFYSRARLWRVAQSGSLFIKHLQLEGKIIADTSYWLTDTLKMYREKRNYSAEISEAIDLVRPLQRLHRDFSNDGPFLAADIGYVFLRNYAIYRCAQEGTFLFDYAALLEELQCLERFGDRSRNQLMQLRLGKHAHRSDHSALCDVSDMKFASHWIADACSHLSIEPIARDTPIRKLATPYATLRDSEAALATHGLLNASGDEMPSTLRNARRMIKKPKDYSWHVSKISDEWVAKVNDALCMFSPTTKSIENYQDPIRL
ncbi:MAG: nucleotidyltransferase domain-containing protein [Aestuariivita sp.]|nr:nucleotidyltransferase domain-containing protein [Aestuariivita sp.]